MKAKNIFLKSLMILILLTLITGCTTQTLQKKFPEAIEGNLDLSSWDFERDGIVNLNGSWEFYWERLINPEVFSDYGTLKPEFIKVPEAWNNYNSKNTELSKDGYATYRLVVTTNLRDEPLGLEIPKLSSAYNLWVNKELLATTGSVGINAEKSIPQFQPTMVFFDSGQGDLELIIQISNFHHQNGGILEHLRLGTEDQIKMYGNWYLAFDLFVFGSLFVVGIYHLVFYFYRRKEWSNLYFGAFCTMIGIRSLFVGKMFVFQLFPDLNWEMALKVEYLTFYLGTPVFIFYLNSILPKEVPVKLIQLSVVTGLIFSSLVLFNPVKVYAQYNVFFQIYAIINIIYLLYALILGYLHKREGAIAIGLAVVFFVATIINDILYESSLIYFSKNIVTTSLSSWGFLVFVFSSPLFCPGSLPLLFQELKK